MEEQNNSMKLLSVNDLMGMKFYIPNYQRGYRWESKQVNRLLDDLFAYFTDPSAEGFYCLQPVVVKPYQPLDDDNLEGGDWYEVIDGQQRLTTLRIICAIYDSMKYKRNKHNFRIHYATRPDMDEIFKTLSVKYDEDSNVCEFVKDGREWNNLDSVYIYHAAETICKWFDESERRENIFAAEFFNDSTQKKSVRIVWYEDVSKKDARDLFNEINDLTVKLSCSELIRSLFLSSGAKYDCTLDLPVSVDEYTKKQLTQQDMKNQQSYINTKWDEIEHRLSDKRIQHFMSNCLSKETRNNIELLFDLMSKKHVGNDISHRDPMHTFIYFNDKINEIGASKLWKEVEACYARICGWIEDKDMYHLIGYLNAISSDDSVISELIDSADKDDKETFKKGIIDRIKNSVQPNKKLSEYSYENKNDYYFIRQLLFLYNVELCRRTKTEEFFPFELFKPLGKWTLEHIHAQNSECLPKTNRKVWQQWADDNIESLNKFSFPPSLIPEKERLIKELSSASDDIVKGGKQCTYSVITTLYDEVVKIYNDLQQNSNDKVPESVHQLSNMTLLTQSENSAIGCSVFAVKRILINKMRNDGTYFPAGTLNVFNKSYNATQQIYEWSVDDRECYLESLNAKLGCYITID